ncbi:histidine phosphatase family protein [Nocardioides nanhaiensis]|uniref:Histidine phosphatase family protein n=1 Tax=Nocardioides nanhaiensis TaxID=1476871 RepID=A0ABP8WHK5_9ACTN
MRLLLIRHGQTPHNVAGALDTAFPGAGLTPLGEAQAGAVPGALAEVELAAVYASRLVRTQLTAAPLAAARGLEVVVRPGLEEIAAGEYEMRSDEPAVRAYVECVAGWMRGELGHALPGGTDGHAFLRRYSEAVRDIAAGHGSTDTVAVVSHGAAIRVFSTLAARLSPEVAADLHLMNTGMSVLDGDPASGWELVRWQSEPLGGASLLDASAHDVTGETAEEALDDVDVDVDDDVDG